MTDNIKELVERFQNRLNEFCSNQYKEVHMRQEFIDRFFEILGWDMYGDRVTSFINREVILEDKVQIEGKTKAPDYGFYINTKRQFFLEAKRASLDIFSDKESAFQLRRYGWSASLPISILTNFKQLAIYDCRIKPERDDFASKARIAKFGFEEYVDKWDELYSLLSREAVQNGSLTTLLEAEKLKVFESQPVDDAFLAEIEDWRLELAPNIFERNDLDIRDLNFAVQAIINRIIFLRLCEDKGIEPYEQLLEIAKSKQIYQKLSKFFKQADKRYNAGLFHFYKERWRTTAPDKWTLSLQISDKYLQRIIQSLYPPNTPYEFSVIPIEILGHVYEQFLGKIIVLDNKQLIQVENKPEVKKAGGVYYTPEYIVNYIVENTVGKLLENKTPDDVSELSILDPACGSGSFLIGAYTYLLDWHLNYYSKCPEEYKNEILKITENTYQLTSPEKKRILLNNIYGVDIDQQAVEISKLSLLLKVLEGETEKSIDYQLELYKERALPDLDNNIKCGNSLINNDFYDNETNDPENEELRYRINAFDWEEEFSEIMENGGFDVVIGNPPYVSANNMSFFDREYFNKESGYKTLKGKWDLYIPFVEKSFMLLKNRGFFSFIIPYGILNQPFGIKLRKLMLAEHTLHSIADLHDAKIFQAATVPSCIPCLQKGQVGKNGVKILTLDIEEFKYNYSIPIEKYQTAEQYMFRTENLFAFDKVLNKIKKVSNAKKLGDLCYISTGAEIHGKEHRTKTGKLISGYSKFDVLFDEYQVGLKPYVEGSAIHKSKSGRYSYPDIDYYLDYNPSIMRSAKFPELFENDKIIVRGSSGLLGILATFDSRQLYTPHKMTILIKKSDLPKTNKSYSTNSEINLKYILGVINSKLIDFYYQSVFAGFIDVYPNYLKSLIIHDFNGNKQQNQLIKLVNRMLTLQQQLKETASSRKKETIQRQINRTDKKIDQLVYELYDLTADEIAIVEESC